MPPPSLGVWGRAGRSDRHTPTGRHSGVSEGCTKACVRAHLESAHLARQLALAARVWNASLPRHPPSYADNLHAHPLLPHRAVVT